MLDYLGIYDSRQTYRVDVFTHTPICFRDIEGINEKVDPRTRITNGWDIWREDGVQKAGVIRRTR